MADLPDADREPFLWAETTKWKLLLFSFCLIPHESLVFFIHWSLWLQLQRIIVTIVSHIVTNLRLFNRKCSVQNSQVVKEIKSASCSIISIKRPTKVAFQLVTVLTFRVQSFMVDQDPCISNICPLPVL